MEASTINFSNFNQYRSLYFKKCLLYKNKNKGKNIE